MKEEYRKFLSLFFLILALFSLIYLERKNFHPSVEGKKIKYIHRKTLKKKLRKRKPKVKVKQALRKVEKFKLAIVIDDVGDSKEMVYEIAKLPREVTPSVLPFRKYSKWASTYLKAKGYDVMIHLPMEPENPELRDRKMLTKGMGREEMRNFLKMALRDVPLPSGINNHEGSLFTSDSESMREFLPLIKKMGIFFLDSRTSSHSVAYPIARKMGIKSCKRDIFLDNREDFAYINGQWEELLKIAEEKGQAIGIGHARLQTLKSLKILMNKLPKKYTLIRVKNLAL